MLNAKIAAKKKQAMLNLSAPGAANSAKDTDASKNSERLLNNFLDAQIEGLEGRSDRLRPAKRKVSGGGRSLTAARPPQRHSVKPVELQNNLINDSQSNISADSSIGSKSGSKLGMLFQNINKKIR